VAVALQPLQSRPTCTPSASSSSLNSNAVQSVKMPPIHGRRNRSGRPGGCRTNNSTRKNFYVHIRPLGQLSLASPPGSLNRVPSSDGNVTSAGLQVTLCDPMWHVSSRSSVATLRTAIYLLLTYYINFREREMNKNTSRKMHTSW